MCRFSQEREKSNIERKYVRLDINVHLILRKYSFHTAFIALTKTLISNSKT